MILKVVRAKNDSSARQFYAPNGKPNYIKKTIRELICIQLQNTEKKGTAKFSTNHRKTGKNFNYFYHGFEDIFSAVNLSTSSAGVTLGSRGYFFLIDTDGWRRSRVNEVSNRQHGLFHIRYSENGPGARVSRCRIL